MIESIVIKQSKLLFDFLRENNIIMTKFEITDEGFKIDFEYTKDIKENIYKKLDSVIR